MPPRISVCLRCLRAGQTSLLPRLISDVQTVRYVSAQAVVPAVSPDRMMRSVPPISRHPNTQPPSHRRPEIRRSQLHRQYASLLRSTPLMLLFQHNNLKSTEWMALRRELSAALRKIDASRAANESNTAGITDEVRIQVIKSGVFGAALRVVEYYRPEQISPIVHSTDPQTSSSQEAVDATPATGDRAYTHGLSRAAYEAAANSKVKHALEPLFTGPVAIVTFPEVSTEHLKAALQILAPKAPNFPAPKRSANPGYWELPVQNAVQKLMLLGARVESKVFDTDGTRWVGSIQGGLDGLRGQLVAMLQGVGGGVTSTLEAASRSLYFTIDSRREMLKEEQRVPNGDKSES